MANSFFPIIPNCGNPEYVKPGNSGYDERPRGMPIKVNLIKKRGAESGRKAKPGPATSIGLRLCL
jgi:hypothetical protein